MEWWILISLWLTPIPIWFLLHRSGKQRGELDRLVRADRLIFEAWAKEIRGQVAAIQMEMQKPVPPEPWTGSFLPTDESSADLERKLYLAEDRAISAGEPTQFSSRPSPTLARPSAREPSTRRGKSSGSA